MNDLFVVGSPRSGTTLIGRFLGSDPSVLDLGEYYGHYFAAVKAPAAFTRVPSDFADLYLAGLWQHSIAFSRQLTSDHGRRAFVDSTPWNLLLLQRLARDYPAAVFLVMLRSLPGVCQSLERSYAAGYQWAGASTRDRAAVWTDLYQHLPELPPGRTIAVSYDRLRQAPQETIERLLKALERHHGPSHCDMSVLARSHATGAEPRSTLLSAGPGGHTWTPAAPYDQSRWSEEDERELAAEDHTVRRVMADLFPIALSEGVQEL